MTTALTVNAAVGVKTASTISNLADEWLKFVDVRPATLATYNRALKNFKRWLADNNVVEVNREVVIAYRESLLESLKATTVNLYLVCVKMFVKFLASKGICPNFTDNIKRADVDTSTHSRAALNVEECKQVFHVMTGGNEKSLRDKAIIGLMMATGLRCCEICRLNVGNIERRGKKIILHVQGKGRSVARDKVILPAQCAAMIQAYLKLRGRVGDKAPLFVSTSSRCKGQRLQSQTISRLAKKALVTAGFTADCYCAHSLRHSFATAALTAGVGLRDVSKALRHKSILVTEIYLHDLAEINNLASTTVANLIF